MPTIFTIIATIWFKKPKNHKTSNTVSITVCTLNAYSNQFGLQVYRSFLLFSRSLSHSASISRRDAFTSGWEGSKPQYSKVPNHRSSGVNLTCGAFGLAVSSRADLLTLATSFCTQPVTSFCVTEFSWNIIMLKHGTAAIPVMVLNPYSLAKKHGSRHLHSAKRIQKLIMPKGN